MKNCKHEPVKNWYCKREPVLFLTLLLMTIVLFLYSNFSPQWLLRLLPETLTETDLGLGFIVLSVILTLFIAPRYLFPSAILSISTSDSVTSCTSNDISLESVLFDGRTITLESDLPQQVRLFFWKKGEYKVYVKYTVKGGDSKCESGIINLYEDRHIEIEIPLTK